MASNTADFYSYSASAGSAKNLQKPTDGGDNNVWGGYINTDLDTIVAAVNATSDKIADANGQTLVDFSATGSAVNHLGITNKATGSGPVIEALGSDTNIDLNINGKGTGEVNITKVDIDSGTIDGTDVTVGASKTLDVSAGTFTSSSAQKQAIVQAGPGSGTLDVSAGTFTSSVAQKTAILAGGTFPAGHIIKHTGPTTFGTGNHSTSSSTYVVFDKADGSPETVPVTYTAGNKLLIMWTVAGYAHAGGVDSGLNFRIGNSASDNSGFLTNSPDGTAPDGVTIYIGNTNSDQNPGVAVTVPLSIIDSPSGTSTTYYLQHKASAGGNSVIYRQATYCNIFEIQA